MQGTKQRQLEGLHSSSSILPIEIKCVPVALVLDNLMIYQSANPVPGDGILKKLRPEEFFPVVHPHVTKEHNCIKMLLKRSRKQDKTQE